MTYECARLLRTVRAAAPAVLEARLLGDTVRYGCELSAYKYDENRPGRLYASHQSLGAPVVSTHVGTPRANAGR